MQAVNNEAKAVEVAATFQTIEEAASQLDGAREEAAATMDAVAQVRLCCKTAQHCSADSPRNGWVLLGLLDWHCAISSPTACALLQNRRTISPHVHEALTSL